MNTQNNEIRWKGKILWSLLFIIIAAASIYAVIMQSKSFSLQAFGAFVAGANPLYLCAAAVMMFCFIFFEGLAIIVICRAFGYRIRGYNGFAYSATDLYFSAITPSATGGQPACAYFMVKDGIPGVVTTVALLINLMVYSFSIVTIGAVVFVLRPSVFANFNTLSRILIILGAVVQGAFVVFFYLLVRHERLLSGICRGTVRLLGKLHLLHNIAEKEKKLDAVFEDYRERAALITGHKKTILKAFLFNLIQRSSQIAVSVFCFLATGGTWDRAFDIFATQSYAVLGSNCVPIPGAMGVSDYLMLDGFGQWMGEEAATSLELLSRSVSFYACILICGIVALLKFIQIKRRKNVC